jgi:hypothetical protein
MKRVYLLTLVILLEAVSMVSGASALGPDATWAEIRSTPDVVVDAPMIPMSGHEAHEISVTDVCRSGGELRAQSSEGVLQTPAAGVPQSYAIEVDRVVWVGSHTYEVPLFTKHFIIPACTN